MERIEAIKCFVRVAEVSSFTKAADSLGLPKASVSGAVQQLESRLGTRLFQRTTRKVQLTPDGQVFYERAKDLLSDLEEIESLFQGSTSDISGRLRVDMSNPMAKNLVIPRLPEFLQTYPNIQIELSSTDRKVDLISEGFDCVIRVGTLADSGLIARPLGQLHLINCASPTYLKRYGEPQTLEDLTQHFLVHYTNNLGTKPEGWEYVDDGNIRTIKMNGKITVNNADAYQAACLAGLGIIQAPETGVRELIKQGLLVEIMKNYRATPMPISLLYPHRRNLSKRVRVFMDWVSELMQSYIS